MSIWSYPERGPWGDPAYPGNASGYVFRDLYRCLQPQLVVDPCVGSGTSIEVAHDEGIDGVGLDLRHGFNVLRDSIIEFVGRPADLAVSHLPYHSMIRYTDEPDDLSRCASVEAYLEKAHQALLNQRDAVGPAGYYATLIGDMRAGGRYYSFQSEFIARLPDDELRAVIIKAQHNCHSDWRCYPSVGAGLPRIGHEYLIVWQRRHRSPLVTLHRMAVRAHQRLRSSWRAIVRQALVALGGEATLPALYGQIAGAAPGRTNANPNWQAKVRQVLQKSQAFAQVERGRWALA